MRVKSVEIERESDLASPLSYCLSKIHKTQVRMAPKYVYSMAFIPVLTTVSESARQVRFQKVHPTAVPRAELHGRKRRITQT